MDAAGKAGGGGALEKLGKEELLGKYRHLLSIAQKAKSAKDGKYYYLIIYV